MVSKPPEHSQAAEPLGGDRPARISAEARAKIEAEMAKFPASRGARDYARLAGLLIEQEPEDQPGPVQP